MRTFQKYLTGVLAATMVLSMTPLMAFAAETDAPTSAVADDTTTADKKLDSAPTDKDKSTDTKDADKPAETDATDVDKTADDAEATDADKSTDDADATDADKPTIVDKEEAKPDVTTTPTTPTTVAPGSDVMGVFADTQNHWAREAIAYTVGKEYFTGVSKDQFSPDSTMNRGMLVTVLYRFAGQPTYLEENPFTDVTDDAYYKSSATWAAVNNIIDGSTGTFNASTNVTREELAVMLYNYAKLLSRDMLVDTGASYAPSDKIVERDLNSFSDKDSVSAAAYDALAWATAKGIITGKTNNTIAPQGLVTRAEMATMIVRFASLT